jgi:hypothetical protein
MPIRPHDDSRSNVLQQEREWFKVKDTSDRDVNRFSYMLPGTKAKTWDRRVDLSTADLDCEIWIIDHMKYVNRPDSIAHKFYGNAKYWWVIAERNNITDPFHGFYHGRKLEIPSMISLKKALGY